MKKETINRIICIALTLVIGFGTILGSSKLVDAKSSYNTYMHKYLKAYQSEDYARASKLAKRLKETEDTTYNKLTRKQKRAYKKVIAQYPVQNIESGGEHMWCYMLTDMDGDQSAELIVKAGSCEADARIDVYTFKKGKVKKVGSTGAGHKFFVVYPGKGLVYTYYHMGFSSVGVVKINKGKLVSKSYGECDSIDELAQSGVRPTLKNYMTTYENDNFDVFK
ncbi:MAG: hypothetical protein IKS48_00025 [Eubacterium sp.]|nr:hypothetical protein [Eubacterium sp.]